MPTLNIIGCGRAGGALAAAWADQALVTLAGICNASPESSKAAVGRLGQGKAVGAISELPPADLWMLGVPDQVLDTVVAALADTDEQSGTVFHLAGSIGVGALDGLQGRGFNTAAVHPLIAFSDGRFHPQRFADTWCVAEGSDAALGVLRPLFTGIGGRWLTTVIRDRALYHAAAVLVSNAPRGLVNDASEWFESSGLPAAAAHAIAASLMLDSATDVMPLRPGLGLTGPIDRGDRRTIEAHLKALAALGPEQQALYRALAASILRLAAQKDGLTTEQIAALKALLSSADQ